MVPGPSTLLQSPSAAPPSPPAGPDLRQYPESWHSPDTIWSLLSRSHGELDPVPEVRLLRASWLIRAARGTCSYERSARGLLPRRQLLEASHPEAFISLDELRKLHERGRARRRYLRLLRAEGRLGHGARAAAAADGPTDDGCADGYGGSGGGSNNDRSVASAVGGDAAGAVDGGDTGDELLPIVAVSMAWESADHPDPRARQLERLVAILLEAQHVDADRPRRDSK